MNADVNEQFHAFIKNGEIQNAEQFLLTHFSTNRYDKFLSNKNGDSAAAIALRNGKIEIYSLLLEKGFRLTPLEDFTEIIEQISSHISEDDKKEIRKIHDKHAQDPYVKYVNILIEKSKVSHDGDNTKLRLYIGLISQAFHELNENEWIVPILKVVSQAENLIIVFDFARKSTEVMVPSTDSNTNGIFYPGEGKVYVGAKDLWKNEKSLSSKPLANENLLEKEDRSKVCGVIAHELCHYAMQLLYQNNCKPYSKEDSVRQFDNILRFCKNKKDVEGIIDIVFDYKLSVRHAELIVCVPHLLAHYKEYPDNVEDMKATFNPLFDFYETRTFVDLESTWEAKNKVKEVNVKFGMSDSLRKNTKISFRPENLSLPLKTNEASIIKSNCPQLTMQGIYQKINSDVDFEYKNILISHKTLDFKEKRDKVLEALESCVKPWLFIDCSEKLYENDSIIDIFKKAKNRRIVFVHQSDESDENVTHKWAHFTDETKNTLALKEIEFQGEKLLLSKILPFDLYSISLRKLFLDEKEIKIGKSLQTIEELTVDRRIEPNINVNGEPRVVILSNEPGMGKTTEWKLMAKRMKEAFPGNWVVFMDLKQFVEAYEKDGEVEATFESSGRIAEYFCAKILTIKDFEGDVFSQLLNEGRVVFLMDGFDEISPTFKQFNIILMTAIIKLTQNRVWISTRPHLEEELKERLAQDIVYKLMPLDINERNELIRKRLESKKFDGKKLEEKLKKVENVILKLEKGISSKKNPELLNPLLLRMILEVLEEKKVFFYSKELNLFTLYKTFIKKTIITYTKKGYDAEQEHSDHETNKILIMHHFERLALINFFGDRFGELDLNLNMSQISNEELARVGLVTLGPTNRMEFVHRTYLEYFIAVFIFDQTLIGSESSRKNLLIFKKGFKISETKMIERFFNDAVSQKYDLLVKNHIKLKEINEALESVVNASFWRELKYICVLMFECKKKMCLEEDLSLNPFYKKTKVFEDFTRSIFEKYSPEQCEKFLSFITECRGREYAQSLILNADMLRGSLENTNHKNMFKYVLQSKQIQDILTTEKWMEIKLRFKNDTEVFNDALRSGHSVEFLTSFEDFFENDEERKSFLLTEDEDGMSCFHYEALRPYGEKETFDKVIETFNRLCGEDAMRNILLKKHLTDGNILQRLRTSPNFIQGEKVTSLWNYMTTLFDKPTLKNFLLESNGRNGAFMTKLEDNPKLIDIFKPFIRENITRQELHAPLSDSTINLSLNND